MSNSGEHEYGVRGRQSAYTTRNRAALISAAQGVLAEFGPDATVEQLVAAAAVSPTTIYNHFGSKENLLRAALEQAWQDWVTWAYDGRPQGENFRTMLDVCRQLFRVSETHPLFAQILRNTLSKPSFVIEAVKGQGVTDLKAIAGASGLDTTDFDKRMNLWAYCIASMLHGLFVTGEMTPRDADSSLVISLAIWNVGPEEARELISSTDTHA